MSDELNPRGSPRRLQRLQEAFDRADYGRSGQMEVKELRGVMRAVGRVRCFILVAAAELRPQQAHAAAYTVSAASPSYVAKSSD
jgi:hypothetical protein